MKFPTLMSAACCLALAANTASALELGAEDFAAARDMTCVLAQESLGYLSEDEYAEMAESVLEGYTQEGGDVIYAQALGYFDGLMFGLADSDARQINARLQEYLASSACTRYTGIDGVSLTL
jgi:hypothetical protein